MRSQNDNLATNDSLTLLEELRGKALYDHQWVEAYWQATIGALQATNSLQENCHGKFLRWYTNVEGFSRQLESYSCAISFAFESQRTLLLPPIFTLHNIFDVENAMYLDEVVSLPLKFANVVMYIHCPSSHNYPHAITKTTDFVYCRRLLSIFHSQQRRNVIIN